MRGALHPGLPAGARDETTPIPGVEMKEERMFWNDPNLYGLTFKDVVQQQQPFLGSNLPWTPLQGIEHSRAMLPRFAPPFPQYGMVPQFVPQVTPQFIPQLTPQFTPFGMTPPLFNAPVTPFPPYFQTAAINPFLHPYGVNPPMFYRPFTF
jgi:hypothetical protein